MEDETTGVQNQFDAEQTLRLTAASLAVDLFDRTDTANCNTGAPAEAVAATYRKLFDAVLASLRGEPADKDAE